MPKESAATGSRERCALILASNLCDGLVIADVLADAGIESINYTSAAELLGEARGGAGIIIIAEEALVGVAPRAGGRIFCRAAAVVRSSGGRSDGAHPRPDAELEATRCGFALCAKRNLA